jgi:hypothetical protein
MKNFFHGQMAGWMAVEAAAALDHLLQSCGQKKPGRATPALFMVQNHRRKTVNLVIFLRLHHGGNIIFDINELVLADFFQKRIHAFLKILFMFTIKKFDLYHL